MKIKFLSIFLIISFYFFPFTNLFCEIPPGFEVYFNNPTGTSDANSPGLDFRFKNYVDLASNTTIYAALYDIDNSTAIAALNSALNRGCTVYFICDADAVSVKTFDLLKMTATYKIRTTAGGEVHNKFCVIENSSVWTGSWNTTNNCTYQNNNNVIIIHSADVANIYKNEFIEMYGSPLRTGSSRFGSKKTLTTNNGTTKNVNGVRVDIYFSPYQQPKSTSKAISDEILLASKGLYFCLFNFSDSTLGDNIVSIHNKNVNVAGIVDLGQDSTQFSKLVSTGIPVVADANRYNLHDKFAVIDPFETNARVITGSHNWSATANEDNDENTVIVYSAGIAQAYYEEFQRLYKAATVSTTTITTANLSRAVENVKVYPSPVTKGITTIAFDLSSNVTSAAVKIYSISGKLVTEIPVANMYSGYNKVSWDCTNDSKEKVASGLYIAIVEATTPDGTFRKLEKFAVLKGK